MSESKFDGNTVDDPVELDARYKMGIEDRRFIDNQIRTIQQVISSTGGLVAPPTVVPNTLEFDWAKGNAFEKTLSAGSNVVTFTNVLDARVVLIVLTGTGGGSTVTWPGGIKWADATVPTQTPTGTDFYTFARVGTTIYGSVVQNMS